MERVEELRQELKEAFETFHEVQKNKWQFLQNFQNTVMDILVSYNRQSVNVTIFILLVFCISLMYPVVLLILSETITIIIFPNND